MKTIIRPETEMKESGASWMGKIPCEWSVSKLKWYLRRIDPRNPGDKQVLSLYREYGVIPKDSRNDNHNATSEDTSKYKYVRVGDFVVNKMKAWQGSVAVSEYDGIVSPAYYVYHFTDDSYHRRYFHYLLRSCYKEEFMRLSGGIRVGQWDLSSNDLDNVLVVIPKKDEQQAIADYLDETCSQIDEIIAEAKASIDEYKELKQSVIFEAVTKGLDKNVEMKEIDGWIRWLPKGWNFRKINGLFNVIGSGTTPKSSIEEYYQGTINWLQSGDINGTVVKNTKKHISDEIIENTSALVVYDAPFIAIAMYGASIGNISIVDINACTNQACCVLSQPTKDIDMGYSFWCIMSAKEELLLSSRGGGQPNISQNIIKQLRIPLPPLMEQRKIVDYLNDKTKEMDSLIIEKESLINDLEAYKKSLIYEVVTGKRRVV